MRGFLQGSMFLGSKRGIWRILGLLAVLFSACAALAGTSATLLLEEPYGKLGFFTATGHAAVYLSGVCAESPLVLRPCAAGELGAVISRYDGVGGYDWVAIPLIPYLYAVDRPEDIPLFGDPKMVAFLRDQYRRKYLETVAPNGKNGETPGGNWYELVGSAYDRTLYGYEIETSPEQDAALIRKLNTSPNRSHFHTVSNNCADFAKDIINFYYPKALHRSVIADMGITTPKQMAKTFVKFTARHPYLETSRFVVPQVPGTSPRSFAVHGVVESFFKSKKYIVPSVVASPIFAGCVAAVYVGTGAGHFDPSRGALMFEFSRDLEAPLGAEDRRAYQNELRHMLEADGHAKGGRVEKDWARLQGSAVPELDSEGRLILQIRSGERVVEVGVTAENVLSTASLEMARQLLMARLQEELRHRGAPKASGNDVARDWELLREAMSADRADEIVAQASRRPGSAILPRVDLAGGNQP